VRIIYLFYWNSCESHTGVTQPLENGLADLKVKGFYRYDSHAVRVPRLECRKGLPLRTLLARLIGFVAAFCNEGEGGVAACRGQCEGVSSTCSPSTVKSRPLPDLPRPIAQRPLCRTSKGRSGGGAVRTVEVELEFETPSHWPRNAATLSSLRRRMRARILSGQPAVFAAATLSRIRAREFGRHEDRNDKNLPIRIRSHRKETR
jgi:hypothetical protein